MLRKKDRRTSARKLERSVHFVAPEVIISFLKKIMPFRDLEDRELHAVAGHCRIDFFPKGERLMTMDETEITHLYLIQRGGVKAFLIDDRGDEVLKDYRGEGAYIGALGIIRGTRANLNIETVEDTFCFLLPRDVFLDLVRNNPSFSHFYLKSFSDQIVATAYKELRYQKVNMHAAEDLYLFSMCAEDLAKPAQKMGMKSTIREVAKRMAQLRIGSMLLHDHSATEDVVGIVTDTDLRMKVVATGRDYNEPVENIMSIPVQTVRAEEICFEVLMKMMATGIRHLAVQKAGRLIGLLTSHDILVLQGSSPFYLFKEIVQQREIEGLYPIAAKIPVIIRNLIKEGGKAGNISRMVSILSDRIIRQLLALLEREMGAAPVGYCWMLMGSEGRREQTLLTDQNSGIVYADPYSDEQRQRARLYFAELARQAIFHLEKCGYPQSARGITAANPRWCQPFSVWQRYLTGWLTEPGACDLQELACCFDLRGIYGDERLAVSLRNHLIDIVPRGTLFLHHMARLCLTHRVPLSFFRNFIIERNGEHRNRLNIRLRGLLPVIGFARVLALKCGLTETNTIARLQALQAEEVLPAELCSAAVRAYELQMQFLIIHQLEQIERGEAPDSFIEPANMTEMERTMLKDGFRVIERLQVMLEKMYPSI